MKTNMINEYVLNQAKKANPEITRIVSVTKDGDTVVAICEDISGQQRRIVNVSLYTISRHYQTRLHNEISSLNNTEKFNTDTFSLKVYSDKEKIWNYITLPKTFSINLFESFYNRNGKLLYVESNGHKINLGKYSHVAIHSEELKDTLKVLQW